MTDNPAVDKRDQILAAAEQLIAESGFQGLSMQSWPTKQVSPPGRFIAISQTKNIYWKKCVLT